MTSSLTQIAKRRIDKSLVELQKEIFEYQRVENNIFENNERIRRFGYSQISSTDSSVNILKDANQSMSAINARRVREIDNITAFIAGHFSLLIDECIEHYEISLKAWIKIRIQQLSSMRKLSVGGATTYICFPAAVAMLSSYLIKTRACDEKTSSRLVSIRQAIRSLCEIYY